jgi:DNA-directed RNA polymerase specialized sigma24 family protein
MMVQTLQQVEFVTEARSILADPVTDGDFGGQDFVDPSEAGVSCAGWTELVERIQAGTTDGMEELYALFSRGIRFYLIRQLGPQEVEDKTHDTFLLVVQAIRRGELRDPARLMGFVRTICRRQIAAHIDRLVQSRREQNEVDNTPRIMDPSSNPEETAIFA